MLAQVAFLVKSAHLFLQVKTANGLKLQSGQQNCYNGILNEPFSSTLVLLERIQESREGGEVP